MKIPDITIGFVGAGRLGSNLSFQMARNGWHIKGIFDLNIERAENAAKNVPTGVFNSLEQLAERADCLIIATTDDAIVDICQRLSEMRKHRTVHLIHASGVLPSSVLRSAGREFSCASMHPVQSLPEFSVKVNPFRSSIVGIEGMARAARLARRISTSIGAQPVDIDPEKKALYHAACALAANSSFAVFATAQEMLTESGVEPPKARKMVEGLFKTALDNWLEKGMDGLTGPVRRNDRKTILEHKTAIRDNADWKELYDTLLNRLEHIYKGG